MINSPMFVTIWLTLNKNIFHNYSKTFQRVKKVVCSPFFSFYTITVLYQGWSVILRTSKDKKIRFFHGSRTSATRGACEPYRARPEVVFTRYLKVNIYPSFLILIACILPLFVILNKRKKNAQKKATYQDFFVISETIVSMFSILEQFVHTTTGVAILNDTMIAK